MFFGHFSKTCVHIHTVGTKIHCKQIGAVVPLFVFAQKLHAQITQTNFFNNGKTITHAVPKLQGIYGQIACEVFLPYIGMNGQFVVECSVIGQQAFNAKYLATQGLETDPDGRF